MSNGTLESLAEVEAEDAGTRMNDGKVNPAGRFVAGTIALNIMCRKDVVHRGLLSAPKERSMGERFVRKLGTRPANPSASGADVLLLDEATRGVEVAAKAEI